MKQNESFRLKNFDFERFSVNVTLLYMDTNESDDVVKSASKDIYFLSFIWNGIFKCPKVFGVKSGKTFEANKGLK